MDCNLLEIQFENKFIHTSNTKTSSTEDSWKFVSRCLLILNF